MLLRYHFCWLCDIWLNPLNSMKILSTIGMILGLFMIRDFTIFIIDTTPTIRKWKCIKKDIESKSMRERISRIRHRFSFYFLLKHKKEMLFLFSLLLILLFSVFYFFTDLSIKFIVAESIFISGMCGFLYYLLYKKRAL